MRFALLMIAALAANAVAQSKPTLEPLSVQAATQLAAERCGKCHGADGRGASAEYPSLAGQHAEYLSKQIFSFKTGQRLSPIMQPIVENLTAGEVRALTAFFSAQQAGAKAGADASAVKLGEELYRQGLPASGVAACASCHGARAAGGAIMPRLAGQNAPYLENQLRGFIKKARTNDNNMHVGLAGLSEPQIRALASYLNALE